MTYLVFGDGLLGNSFKLLNNALVLSKQQCDITDKDAVYEVIKHYKPLVVINAAGIVPRNNVSTETIFKVNSFAPHHIADVCDRKCKFIHISTDCVFYGTKGRYTERDKPDATDTYGMSKIFGEPYSGLTLRMSFIGLPDPRNRGLLAWAQQQKEIVGYDQVFWNGITILEANKKIIEFAHEDVTGLRHVYSYTVSKYELLLAAKEIFGWKTKIYKETDKEEVPHRTNKTLNSLYATGFVTKPLKRQLKELINYV